MNSVRPAKRYVGHLSWTVRIIFSFFSFVCFSSLLYYYYLFCPALRFTSIASRYAGSQLNFGIQHLNSPMQLPAKAFLIVILHHLCLQKPSLLSMDICNSPLKFLLPFPFLKIQIKIKVTLFEMNIKISIDY